MKRARATRDVRAAQTDVALAGARLERDWKPWRAHWRKHRAALVVTGGLASGAALGLLPVRWWGGIGAVLGRLAAFVARSSLMPALTGAALARLRGTSGPDTTPR